MWAGGLATYAIIVSMAITSFPTIARRMSPRSWKALHIVGGYVILLVLTGGFGGRALVMPEHVPAGLLSLAVIGLRCAAAWATCTAILQGFFFGRGRRSGG